MNNVKDLVYTGLDRANAILYLLAYVFFQKPQKLEEKLFAPRKQLLKDVIKAGKPAMIARFGSNEISVFFEHEISQLSFWHKQKTWLTHSSKKRLFLTHKSSTFSLFCSGAGFFPKDRGLIGRYAEIVRQDAPLIDILGGWNPEEVYFKSLLQQAKRFHLVNLDPLIDRESNFLPALEHKKVLVIHPFAETIQKQYLKKHLLFPSPDFLPTFDLMTLKAVQSQAYEKNNFKNWFEALDFMKKKMEKFFFDVAIIGCGAYGMHLAAHAKRMGKIGFHMGANVQRIFGIQGKRWEGEDYYFVKPNGHWTRPSKQETPKQAHLVEDACYW